MTIAGPQRVCGCRVFCCCCGMIIGKQFSMVLQYRFLVPYLPMVGEISGPAMEEPSVDRDVGGWHGDGAERKRFNLFENAIFSVFMSAAASVPQKKVAVAWLKMSVQPNANKKALAFLNSASLQQTHHSLPIHHIPQSHLTALPTLLPSTSSHQENVVICKHISRHSVHGAKCVPGEAQKEPRGPGD